MPRNRDHTPAVLLCLGVLASLLLYRVCDHYGICVKPDRPPAVEAGVSHR